MLSTTLLLAASIVVGQAEAAPNPLQKFADDFEGTWDYTWTAAEDHEEGNWKAGDAVPIRTRIYWELDQAALGYELSATLPATGKQAIWTKGFYAWNPETKQVTLYSFGVNGNIRQDTYSKEGDTWSSEGWSLNREGEKRTRETKIEIRDDGKTHILDRVVNGEKKPSSTWKRKGEAEK